MSADALSWLRTLLSPVALLVPCGSIRETCDASGINISEALAPFGRLGGESLLATADERTFPLLEPHLRLMSARDFAARYGIARADDMALRVLRGSGPAAGSLKRYGEYFSECLFGALVQDGVTLLYPSVVLFIASAEDQVRCL